MKTLHRSRSKSLILTRTMNKKEAKIIFMGTPDISRQCLSQLIDDGYNITAVFTREDKPVGRKRILTAPPVKQVALEHSIPVYQPKTMRGRAAQTVKELAPDMIIVVAYGRILPKEVIDVPAFGCLNLHVSLLPKYRGAAPIQWALINGEKQTGVTVMRIDEGLDTGDIIDVLPIDIDENETRPQLFDKVARQGKLFLSRVAEDVLLGRCTFTPQEHEKATLAPPLTKEMADFSFDEPAAVLHNKIRGQQPWPGAQFTYEGKKVKVHCSRLSPLVGKTGQILSVKPLTVACADGALELVSVQPRGGKTMDGTAWCAGRRLKKGDYLL